MNKENGEKKEEVKEEKKESEKKEEIVTMTREQYSGLLDRVAELEEMSLGKNQEKTYGLDELVDEGKGRKGVEKELEITQGSEEIDNMSNTQVINLILEQVNKGGQQIMTELQTMKVLREIDKCESKYDDFWKYGDEIRRIAIENPSLSIERAYHLAKSEKGEKKVEKEGETGKGEQKITRTEKILNLPPRGSGGEKPGAPKVSTKGSETKSLQESAKRAWDEVVGKDKQIIE